MGVVVPIWVWVCGCSDLVVDEFVVLGLWQVVDEFVTNFGGGVVFVRSFSGWIDLGLAGGWWRSWVWVMVVDEKG